MRLNDDPQARLVLDTREIGWAPSPSPGVRRRMLDRIGDERAIATSIVEYAAGSSFAAHPHLGGEEIFVLAGGFADERGEYPEGTYLRNPPGSRHAPRSAQGCTLFVKLGQFTAGDSEEVRLNTGSATWLPGLVSGLSVLPLHAHDGVSTALVRWAPRTRFGAHTHPGGEEILVLAGTLHDEYGAYPAGTWIRSPRYSAHAPFTLDDGALIYVKVGHIGASFIGAGPGDADSGGTAPQAGTRQS